MHVPAPTGGHCRHMTVFKNVDRQLVWKKIPQVALRFPRDRGCLSCSALQVHGGLLACPVACPCLVGRSVPGAGASMRRCSGTPCHEVGWGTSTGPWASGHQPLKEGGGRVTHTGLRAPFSECHQRLFGLSMISRATLGTPHDLLDSQQRQRGLRAHLVAHPGTDLGCLLGHARSAPGGLCPG